MASDKERGNQTESPLEAAAGAAGARATEAFAILGNETRLAILLALWEAYEPYAAENAVSFTALRDRVGLRQGTQFTYHLDQLVGHFVRKTDDGYELRRAGRTLVQTVIAGTALGDPAFDRTEIDRACPLCSAPTEVTYDDEFLFHVCTECDGRVGNYDRYPEGMLSAYPLDPTGLRDRSPEGMLSAAYIRMAWDLQTAIEGVCSTCSARMNGWLEVCDDHESGGVCANCERRHAAEACFRCPVCKSYLAQVVGWLIKHHPAVVAFYYDHGIHLQYEGGDAESFQPRRALHLIENHEQELIAEDPPRVRVTIQYEGDELAVTVDEDLDVIEVAERA